VAGSGHDDVTEDKDRLVFCACAMIATGALES